jgi:cell division protein FtsQ
MWMVIGGGMLVLLIAAMGKQKREHCKDYSITIKGATRNHFISETDVQKMLQPAANGTIRGQKKSTLNLQLMEQALERSVWIKDAELYFDNRDVLHISVEEREPIARLFTVGGKSFYIDQDEMRIPLSMKQSARVPVFTGFPEKVLGRRDSVTLDNVRDAALFIANDPFWMAQVAQINIDDERNFEMIPVVGNHIVKLGDGQDMGKKFHRLYAFYQNVLSKTGFEKYRAINVQYAGQVIGVKDEDNRRDTAQLRKNVEALLRQAREMQNDSLVTARALKEQKAIQVDPRIAATEKNTNDLDGSEQENNLSNPVPVTDPVPMKPLSDSKHNKKQDTRKPKAVMKPRGNQ